MTHGDLNECTTCQDETKCYLGQGPANSCVYGYTPNAPGFVRISAFLVGRAEDTYQGRLPLSLIGSTSAALTSSSWQDCNPSRAALFVPTSMMVRIPCSPWPKGPPLSEMLATRPALRACELARTMSRVSRDGPVPCAGAWALSRAHRAGRGGPRAAPLPAPDSSDRAPRSGINCFVAEQERLRRRNVSVAVSVCRSVFLSV